ncbi:elongation factor 1 alpha-like protein [[Candida] anglica]|uniref:Elongation factor 1 alpha-like protein n=1 Tax=[Candida] anglica TaxID=148631 RepID=A0ABP0EI40_9ASCO
MPQFDDDDLEDYQNYSAEEEAFNEEALDDAEYDKLYASLPILKQQVADYNDEMDELDMKEALYYNYYAVEEAVKELKEKYPKKKVKKVVENFKVPSPDQKILDAQKAAFEENMGGLSLDAAAEKQKEEKEGKEKVPKATKPFKKTNIQSILASAHHSKPHKSFVVIGHVDAGKSTLLGRLLYDVGAVDAKTLNKLTREAEKAGKGSFALAWVMDQTSEERSRGVTVDMVATNFETATSRYTAIDAPGHRDFVPQMINGVSQASYALVVVDSVTGEFESGLLDGQTREHALLAKNLGVERVCVVVNKMDREEWSESRYHTIQEQMTTFLTENVGFETNQIDFIPLSGLSGNNLVKRDSSIKQFDWYKGQTLVGWLDSLDGGITHEDSAEFCLSINDIYEPTANELQLSGKVLSGTIQPGQTIMVAPAREYLQIQSINVNEKAVDVAFSGEIAALKFKTSQTSAIAISGDLAVSLSSSVQSTDKFTTEVRLFDMTKPLLVGTPFVLFRNNCHTPARITKIVEVLDSKKKKKMHLVSKQSAVVEIQCDRAITMTTFDVDPVLGRVVLRREGTTIGAGKITKI